MSKVYGLGGGKIVMGPDFTATRDEKGLWKASGEFRVLRSDFERNDVYSKFLQGNSIGAIAGGSLSSAWNFLVIEKVTPTDIPGGITVISVDFTGYTEENWEFDSDKNKTYTRTGSTVERSIFEHPKFKEDVSGPNPNIATLIKLASEGTIRARDLGGGALVFVPSTGQDTIVGDITDPKEIEWFDEIVIRGNTTYLAPAMEWTESTTGLGKLQSGEFSGLGYIDSSVPGSPAAPPDETWLFTSVTEDIQRQGDGANSYSRTWTSGKWSTLIYTKP